MGPCCLVVKDWCLASYPMLPMGSTKCASGGGKPTEDVESLVAGHITPQKRSSKKRAPLFSEKNWLTIRQKSISEWICFPQTALRHRYWSSAYVHDGCGRACQDERIDHGGTQQAWRWTIGMSLGIDDSLKEVVNHFFLSKKCSVFKVWPTCSSLFESRWMPMIITSLFDPL